MIDKTLLDKLEKKLEETQRVQIGEYAETESVNHPRSSSGGDGREKVWDEPTGEMIPIYANRPDFPARLKAVEGLGQLLSTSKYTKEKEQTRALLERTYSNIINSSREMRTLAGQYLGHSRFKIFWHNFGWP